MSSELCFLSATDLLAAYRARRLSPVDVTKAVLAQIERLDPAINGFCGVWADEALAQAKASEARWIRGAPEGRLDGVPVSLKDLMMVKGKPTGRGSLTSSDSDIAADDAPSIARLRAANAVFLGRTTTPEFGWKGCGDSPRTGITRNPWNLDRNPGGSSSGAATAAATGMGCLALGSDGGGSIRMPAGFCGIYGLKANYGRVPAYPASAYGTLSHVGPMTRTVDDAALMLTVMAGPDTRDWQSLPDAGVDFTQATAGGVAGWRIAYSPDLGYAKVDPEIAALVRKAAEKFSAMGAIVEEVSPGFANPLELFRIHWYAGAANLMRSFPPEKQALMDPGLLQIADEGARYSLMEYMEAMGEREALGQHMKRFHETYRLLLTPTLPLPAFEAGEEFPVDSGMTRWFDWTPFSYPFNLTRQPAATIPCGVTSGGLPAGLQIVGALYDEASVLRASRAYEEGTTFLPPPMART
ncbi:aspartyl-tRNA(Asn)/glutamyl-tRNA(Gln) amidotransferase subunit A [Stella humosa]|uniref:Aspartyl-tRNA(Asn)/glutamyl-tRNA(Gln) amidotransferase subunit A n=1 Tax=Stella humosa TaxID=94 RepID=A0A3N1MG67_9PROT|nr:amidase [Stella humosa]ROQ01610.1 aspartyl-tRNA(Asn)/glutamyl-tRNA(Gln) amidotransferase subunit A [Stella humosa]BBK31991.1 amidase [Stella humosa]